MELEALDPETFGGAQNETARHRLIIGDDLNGEKSRAASQPPKEAGGGDAQLIGDSLSLDAKVDSASCIGGHPPPYMVGVSEVGVLGPVLSE